MRPSRLPVVLAAAPLLPVLLGGCAAGRPGAADLVIRDATVLDTRTGRAASHRTVVVRGGRIAAVVPAGSAEVPAAARVLEARGRLLTPGLVDVHGHSADVLADTVNETGNTEARRLSMAPDSITAYRRRFARAYLPYGVTTVREAGGDDRYMALMRAWMRPAPWAPDFYPSGGALVSPDPARPTPYAGHRVVADSADAVRTVRAYHAAGFRHVKLYWRLRAPEFRAALAEAQVLGMVPFAHIDNKVFSVRAALGLGLRHFEHAHTLAVEAATGDELTAADQRMLVALRTASGGPAPGGFYLYVMEVLRELGPRDPRMTALIGELARAGRHGHPHAARLRRPARAGAGRDGAGGGRGPGGHLAGRRPRAGARGLRYPRRLRPPAARGRRAAQRRARHAGARARRAQRDPATAPRRAPDGRRPPRRDAQQRARHRPGGPDRERGARQARAPRPVRRQPARAAGSRARPEDGGQGRRRVRAGRAGTLSHAARRHGRASGGWWESHHPSQDA
jgi:hypothetical protein